MRLLRLPAAVILAGAVFSQSPAELFEKAPPHLDDALRARISKFYQAHVDGKFRLADTVVAEDSKDAFFEADKNRYNGFEIVRVAYSDNFTRAKAVVSCETDFFLPGVGKKSVKIPLTTLWKYTDGEWWWYVEKDAAIETPFGLMKDDDAKGKASVEEQLSQAPSVLAIQNQVRVSKMEARLSSYEAASDEVIVKNGMPGTITLSLHSESIAGYEAKLDRTELKAGETARVSFHCKPIDKRPKQTLTATLRVEPTGQIIPLKVTFAVPPEVEKLIPK